jgi:DNA methyltransferase 1-associated protein 1
LESRTPEQIAEEEALFIEVKRLEQNERRFRKDRDDLLRTLSGVESGLADLAVDDEGLSLASLNTNGVGSGIDTKRKKRGYYDESPSTPSTATAMAPIIKRPQSAKSAAHGLFHLVSSSNNLD